MIRRVFGRLWSLARLFPTAAPGIRFGSGASVLLTFLFGLSFVIGLGLMGLGVDLNAVELWLERQSGWLDIVGTIAFKGVLLLALAASAAVVTFAVVGRSPEDRPGVVAALIALAIGYLSFVGVFLV